MLKIFMKSFWEFLWMRTIDYIAAHKESDSVIFYPIEFYGFGQIIC